MRKEVSMETNLQPARAIAPGRILTREMEARGLPLKDLARILGRPTQAINEIVNGTMQITPETARELAKAFGTSAEFWSNTVARRAGRVSAGAEMKVRQ